MKLLKKTAVKLTDGTSMDIESLDGALQILYLSSDRLDEPVSWGWTHSNEYKGRASIGLYRTKKRNILKR